MGKKAKLSGLPSITTEGLSMLLEILGLSHASSKSPALNDVVIIAIDFEGTPAIRNKFVEKEESQVGLAILDTTKLCQVSPENLISSFNFATGSPSYVAQASRNFLFGETVAIQSSAMAQTIQECIPRGRNVVLVGYNVQHELLALRALGFEFSQPPSGILDVPRVANEVRQCRGGSLRDLLRSLGCPFHSLHTAGNDANFTLRALLLLAVEWCASQQRHKDDKVLKILRDTSNSPVPRYINPEILAAKKREKSQKKRKSRILKSVRLEKNGGWSVRQWTGLTTLIK